MSRLDAGEIELKRQSIAVDSLFVEVLQSHYMVLNEKNIAVEVRLPEDIGIVWIDDLEIKRAIGNLFQNAMRHTPYASTIVLEAKACADDFVEIAIIDQGPGIAEVELNRVFDRFYRIDPSRGREDGGGSGLGLEIVQSIVRRHGGDVGVQSRLGEGSRFWLTVPRTMIVGHS